MCVINDSGESKDRVPGSQGMRLLRFSIAGLMGLIAVAAIEVSALRSASDASVDACRLLTTSLLVCATFLARNRRAGEGAFWFGFAVLGWAAFVLVLDTLAGMRSSSSIISRLPFLVIETVVDQTENTGSYAASLHALRQLHVLHLMLIPPIALVGGICSWLVDQRRERRSAADPSQVP
jgi:hypothetical protein